MDKALIELIHRTIGIRRSYIFNDVYVGLDALVTLMNDGEEIQGTTKG